LLDAVVFSGGEPTLQRSLPAALREVRALGFKVGLHTAGPYPERLTALIPLLDWVALDIKALPDGYQAVTEMPGSGEAAWRSLDVLQASDVAYEVRTTIVPGWTADEVVRLADALAESGVHQYALQACATDRALDPGLLPSTHSLAELASRIDKRRFSNLILRGERVSPSH
jgi:pyruvate formate lyase activating enzyme